MDRVIQVKGVGRLSDKAAAEQYANRGTPSAILVHRLTLPGVDNAYATRRAFADRRGVGRHTGGRGPYHSLYTPSTRTLHVATPSWARTPHAMRWNQHAYALAIVRDLRVDGLSDVEWGDVVDILTTISRDFNILPDLIGGHTEFDKSTGDPSKECPGRCLPLGELRASVAASRKMSPDFQFELDCGLIVPSLLGAGVL